ncbi:serine protease snake-like [Helicoverpa zea]|uniref:serine protease snake-like n=1 Tax=Helicoverpa zea TaxID=7113 RepID=UPI001F580716|nr:serine protease snake-like [Helicoverpa zea]
MYKYIAVCVCVCLCGVAADLNKEEGASCEWDGVKGQCVKETRCLTTLDTRGDKHPVCSTKDDVKIVCCTDCELVNDTRNVVMSPTTGFFFKDGTKARDSCLEYLKTLPYKCHDGGFYSGISKEYDDERKCHSIGLWGVGGSPPPGHVSGPEYPHQAVLGYGGDLSSAMWLAGGTVLSDRFILTAAHAGRSGPGGDDLKFVALGVNKLSDPPSSWQTHKVKRFIPHPEYKAPSKYHDIALIETETPITFDKNVLPACLHVEAVDDDTAKATTWRDIKGNDYTKFADTLQTINLEKFTDEECKNAYGANRHLKNGIDTNTQMCYGSRSQAPEACMGLSGEPLLVSNQFSRCIYAVIGVTSFGQTCRAGAQKPDVFTRVAFYKPWIESVVWA